ncbi:proline and serine-rich protein 3 isoform X2 [Genypterus blacodes]|uniref:proline and serine-rich protein 3 isoform X2 n=1 Tax=Genypterus blacodes TaxID=154954 RepID=UPI003F770A3D
MDPYSAAMKSSGAVFTKQNPFIPTSSVGKTHYHPSSPQRLSKTKKKPTLSPVRLSQPVGPQSHTLSSGKQHLPEESDRRLTSVHPDVDAQPKFTESWPSMDYDSSSTSTNSADMETSKLSIVSSKQADQKDSLLAKYIERFRYGQPQSREERRHMDLTGEEQLPFWWMSRLSSPSSSTPTKSSEKDVKDDRSPVYLSPVGHGGSTSSMHRGSLTSLSETTHGELDDTEILELQERGSRLVQRGERRVSEGSLPISSEGVGCSDFSSPVSVDEPMRRPLFPSIITSATVKSGSGLIQAAPSQKLGLTPSMVPPTHPEEDILFQWRLRRKMELAREPPQSHQYISVHGSSLKYQDHNLHWSNSSGHTQQQLHIQPTEALKRPNHSYFTAPQSVSNELHRPCPSEAGPCLVPGFAVSGSPLSQLQSNTCVPAHMHLLCGVLPCPLRSSNASQQQRTPQRLAGQQTRAESDTMPVLGNSTESSTDKPASKHKAFPSSGATEEERTGHHKKAERNKKEKLKTKQSEDDRRASMSSRTQKKSTRSMAQSERADEPRCTKSKRDPKQVPPRTQQGQEQERHVPSRENSADCLPPPSPVRSAIAQVVSEALFPPVDSRPVGRPPVSPAPPLCTAPAPPQSPLPPGLPHNSMEVISQLLQEAEDSDEKEFENDPVLQFLRKQRRGVKERIREVDFMLGEFQEE